MKFRFMGAVAGMIALSATEAYSQRVDGVYSLQNYTNGGSLRESAQSYPTDGEPYFFSETSSFPAGSYSFMNITPGYGAACGLPYLCIKNGKVVPVQKTYKVPNPIFNLFCTMTSSAGQMTMSAYSKMNTTCGSSTGSHKFTTIPFSTTFNYKLTSADRSCAGHQSYDQQLYNGGGLRLVRSPLNSEACGESPIEVYVLNPYNFWNDAVPIQSESSISAALVSGSQFPYFVKSGMMADSVAADGVSKIIVAVVVTEDESISIENTGKLGGVSIYSPATWLSTTPTSVTSITISRLVSVPGSNKKVGLVVYHAPKMPQNSDDIRYNQIVIRSGSLSRSTNIELVHPPVLLIHGINSSGETWRDWQSGLFPKSSFASVNSISYSSLLSFDHPAVLQEIDRAIKSALNAARNRGVVVSQIYTVGHSMGGLVARKIATRTSPLSFNKSQVGKILTINSPHLGSPLASIVYPIAKVANVSLRTAYQLAFFSSTIGTLPSNLSFTIDGRTVLSKMGFSLTSGLASIKPGSVNILNLPSSTSIRYETISSYVEPAQIEISTLKGMLELFNPTSLLSTFFAGQKHDLAVSLPSQIAGGGKGRTYPGLAHIKSGLPFDNLDRHVLGSSDVASYAACRLKDNLACAPIKPAISLPSSLMHDFNLAGINRNSPAKAQIRISSNEKLEIFYKIEFEVVSLGAPVTKMAYHISGPGVTMGGTREGPGPLSFTPTTTGPLNFGLVTLHSDGSYSAFVEKFNIQPPSKAALLEADDVYLKVGGTAQLSPTASVLADKFGTINIANTSHYSVISGSNIASVTQTGLVTGLSKGDALIRISYLNLSVIASVRVN